MMDLNDLYYFVKVVDHRGFAPAGRALGMPKSRLSRRIALLEERLGVRLLQRSTRRFALTEPGQIYLVHCRAMLVEAEAAQEAIDIRRSDPCGTVRLSCPLALLETRVAAMLSSFMLANPRVSVQLDATNRRVDVIAEGLDLAIRVRPPPLEDSELVLRILGQRAQCLVAAPALLDAHGMPHAPTEVPLLPSLGLGVAGQEQLWTLDGPAGARVEVRHHPRLLTRSMMSLRTAAVAGVGVVQLPVMMMRDELQEGRLVRVLPQWAPRPELVHLVYPSRRGLLPAVRALIEHLAERFAGIDED